MKLKAFIPIIVSVIIFGVFLLLPASWFEGLINNKTLEEQRINISDQVLKGTEIQDKMFESDKYYPIYGSSELGKDDPFNPGLLLNNKQRAPKAPFLIGTGGSTDLVNAVEAASQYHNLKGKKMAFIISPQWFTNNGLTNVNFKARVSDAQINQLFMQSGMSNELKQRYATRLSQFKDVKDRYYLKEMKKHPNKVKGSYLSSFKAQQLKKIEAIKSILPVKPSPLAQVDPINDKGKSWKGLTDLAEKHGQSQTKSNNYGIRDEYWKLINSHKRKINRDYEFNVNSPEFQDLALFIDTMNEAGADVEYIILPSNGKWYDHIGIKQERRQKVYNKINHTITQRGGKVYNMTDKDYEPYVISDAVHVGWKGWVYISENIAHHMNGNDNHKNHKPSKLEKHTQQK
ncbi:D-alanyl-lipoteichoic acid biosynthesis protein DltD [Staphylococcus sp. ACRSN]|uniref:D-alanyl-lipoteichoic acid biosynthesis protein DltD n=1 Tax=Staphylococcus sp. ACRSN TaxID=2918214 RepID=UPI001EF3A356|nr:D-alanyl-lipoteichoic acid biosynthesis protein DltD [Staphylococcus sp. ACRSN]MCG7339447.1 D-alanyl-lipoteichoic acid biosynthesis protein DltD [Staphylococcus sp. ACRSN]